MILANFISYDQQEMHESNKLDMSNREAILAVVAEFAETFGLEQSDIAPSATLHELGVDSLQLIELIFRFEEAFKIQVPIEAFGQQTTVADAVATIERLIEVQVVAQATE
jgi:acyl carrier protein